MAEAMDWEQRVAESNGQSVFVPDALVELVKEWRACREAFNKELDRLAKLEIENSLRLQTIMLEMRKYLHDAGREDVWTKDIGFEMGAMADGKYIVNITEGQPRG